MNQQIRSKEYSLAFQQVHIEPEMCKICGVYMDNLCVSSLYVFIVI